MRVSSDGPGFAVEFGSILVRVAVAVANLKYALRSIRSKVTGYIIPDMPHPMPILPAGATPAPRTPEQERLHRKQCLAAGFRLFAKFGYDEGVAGHITARDPEQTDHFWVNPFGMDFSMIRASDLILVSETGEVVEGKHPVNAAAFAIHSSVHKAL